MNPNYSDSFRCIGAECSDTCCSGWRISVDKASYHKYQDCTDPRFQSRFRELITINTVPTDYDFASIQAAGSVCPFLSERLCSIQQHLGVEYLSRGCATYPRLSNLVDGTQERSLDLSCPEAARLVLTDPVPITLSLTPDASPALKTRELVLSVLQDRRQPLSRRLALLGMICDANGSVLKIEGTTPSNSPVDPGLQLKIVLELITERVRIDFTPQPYLDLYKAFAQGLQIDRHSTWNEMGHRYAAAYHKYYAPLIRDHEALLERYLACYAYKTLLPWGSPLIRRVLQLDQVANPMSAQYIVMIAYYAIIKAVIIGLAVQHKTAFGAEHVIRAIQSCSRTLEHCTPYPARILELLASRSITDARGIAVLSGDCLE